MNKCINCGKDIILIPQISKQTYCSSDECQKKRKTNWQKQKLKTDPDYKENQIRAQKAWANRNKDYWQKYRELNQNNDKFENVKTAKEKIIKSKKNVKMDSSKFSAPLVDGIYTLRIIAARQTVNMDSWVVEITRIEERFLLKQRKEMT